MLSGNKRPEEREELVQDSISKRIKSRFRIGDFLRTTFGEHYESNTGDQKIFIEKVKMIATLIADAAMTNHFDDHQAIATIILQFATSHLKTYKIFLPDPSDPTTSSATLSQVLLYQLQERLSESLSRMEALISYLTEYKEHNPLSGLFDERKQKHINNVAELIINLLTLVDHTYLRHGTIPPEHFVDYLTIEHFLTNKPLIETYLDELEQHLQQHARAKNITDMQTRPDGRLALPAAQPGQYKRHKILSDVICDWSKQHGFTAQAKIIGLLSHRDFLGLLSSLTLLKDNAVDAGEYHGAWSHAIQWYCIMEHQKRNHFLRHEPLQLYKGAGPIWNKVFDLLGDTDYTCAPHVTHRMYYPDAMDRWPLLAGSITRIYNKMHLSGMNYKAHLREKCGEQAYLQGYTLRNL